jgi:hypothetical protein
MATATVVSAWKSPDGMAAYLAVSVAGDDPSGPVEYVGSTPTHDGQGNALPLATLKTNLVAAVQARRDAQLAAAAALAISGQVTV